ncbi:Protein of unknown function DUF81 [gamma proteobacterium IMCC2047]|nr:Protein of unknown function DUF81 [gamma proteobacterium IMCC2047]
MMMGMPADVANATNRLGVGLQCVVGVRGFKRHDKLDLSDAIPIVGMTLGGGLVGALAASYLPNTYLKPVLLGAMVTMALIILIKPSVVMAEEGEPIQRLSNRPQAKWILFVAGIYGGFVQAGVGFMLIAAIAGSLRYDLVRTNALKMLCTIGFTFVALAVFIVRGQVEWLPGLVLACGTMIGAHYAVKMAIKVSQKTLKWFLFVMTLFACGAAMMI